MQKLPDQTLLFSPSDLIRIVGSPFASWVKRYNLEHRDRKIPEDPDPIRSGNSGSDPDRISGIPDHRIKFAEP